jgi:hypothetical protein
MLGSHPNDGAGHGAGSGHLKQGVPGPHTEKPPPLLTGARREELIANALSRIVEFAQATYGALPSCSIGHKGNGVEAMADKLAACVRGVVGIANGDGTVAERRKAAEQRIAKLLQDEADVTRGYHRVAMDLRDRFKSALNAEHDHDAREVLAEAIHFLHARIGLV